MDFKYLSEEKRNEIEEIAKTSQSKTPYLHMYGELRAKQEDFIIKIENEIKKFLIEKIGSNWDFNTFDIIVELNGFDLEKPRLKVSIKDLITPRWIGWIDISEEKNSTKENVKWKLHNFSDESRFFNDANYCVQIYLLILSELIKDGFNKVFPGMDKLKYDVFRTNQEELSYLGEKL